MLEHRQRNGTVRTPPGGVVWFAVPVAIMANALLFYVLASARTTPAVPHIEKRRALPVAVTHMPIPEISEPDTAPPEPDLVPIVSAPEREVERTTLPDTTAVPTPRLLDGMQAIWTELPGLPVASPGEADLRPVASEYVSGAGLPHSLAGVDRPPKRIAGALPRMPSWARRRGLEGTVVLRFIVTAQGDVTDIHVSRIEGDERFGREAARTVTTWRFDPATRRGRPVPCWCFQKVNFKLDY